MGKINELIQELCPDGVEYVKIKDVCKRQKGMNITAQQMRELHTPNGQIKIFAAGNTVAMFKEEDVPSKNIIKKPSIIVKSRGNISFEYCTIPFSHKGEIWSYSALNDIILKYIYYYLLSKSEQFQLTARANAVKLPQLCVGDTDDYEIPLPPLSVQQQIVEILDTFTGSISNLQEELALREKQMEYYRENLLLFVNEEVKKVILQDISNIMRGKRLTTRDLKQSGEYPVFHGGVEPIGYYTKKNRSAGSVMIINVGASAGSIGFCNKDFWSSDGCFCFTDSDKLNQKFLYYVLKKAEFTIKSKVRKAGIPTLDSKVIERFKIPVPSLSRQQEIVDILDTFESMIANIKEEMELRQKQYEYYREKLLTFERKGV